MSKTMVLTKKLYQDFVLDKLRESGNSGPLIIELDPIAFLSTPLPQ